MPPDVMLHTVSVFGRPTRSCKRKMKVESTESKIAFRIKLNVVAKLSHEARIPKGQFYYVSFRKRPHHTAICLGRQVRDVLVSKRMNELLKL